MDFNLVFTKSGDTIKLVSHNADLVNYYIESLNSNNSNNFTISNDTLLNDIEYLKKCIIDIDNFFLTKFKFTTFSEFVGANLYNQTLLNKIHRVWVEFQIDKEKIISLLSKVDNKLLKKFKDINNTLHSIESAKFKITNFESKIWSCKNIFSTKIIDFNNYNVKIVFNDLGRFTFDKWRFHDTNMVDIDTSDFKTLSGELELKTNRPYTSSAPETYVKFCADNNIDVIGRTVGLGNFVQSVEVVQEILYRNIKTGCTNLKLVV